MKKNNKFVTEYFDDVLFDVTSGDSMRFLFSDYSYDEANQTEVETTLLKDIKIDLVVNKLPFVVSTSYDHDGLKLVMSESKIKSLGLEQYFGVHQQFTNYTTLITSKDYLVIEEDLVSMTQEKQYEYGTYIGYTVFNKTKDNLFFASILGTVDLAALIVTLFITIICISNLLNVLASSSRQRLKEYAVYRSVGMEIKDLRMMVFYETILNSWKPLIFGLLAGTGVSYLMYAVMKDGINVGRFYIPMTSLLMAVAMIIIIQMIQLVSSMSVLKRSNIAQDLKRIDM